MTYHTFLFLLVALFSILAVMSANLLIAAIMLALTSVSVALVLFDFSAPWAAVFELSVCAGLITVLFVSAVSLLRNEECFVKESKVRFAVLPLVIAIAAIAGWIYLPPFFENLSNWARFNPRNESIGTIIWNIRRADLLGQISILAAGVFVIKSIFPSRRPSAK